MRKKIKNSLDKINLNSKNTIIIDDCPYFWPKDFSNLLLSKRFFDYKIMNLLKNYENLGNYGLITEYSNGKLSFISGGKQLNKIKNKELLFPLNVESKDYSEKIQLNYLSEF